MEVDDLIKETKGPWNKLVFTDELKEDIKKLLIHNDENPNNRVSSERVVRWLLDKHDIKCRRTALVSYVKREFGRKGWVEK